jgi:nitroreductase
MNGDVSIAGLATSLALVAVAAAISLWQRLGLERQIVWAATRAPSGGNRQGWRFIVVTDTAKKKQLQ